MLIAIMTFLFLGGGGSGGMLADIGDVDGSVKEHVIDDERKKESRATLKQMKQRTKALNKTIRGLFKAANAQSKARVDFEEEVNALWLELQDANDDYNRDMIELRFELQEQLTREEWALVFPEPV